MLYCHKVTAVDRLKTLSCDVITVQHHDLECDIAFIQQFNSSLHSDAEEENVAER